MASTAPLGSGNAHRRRSVAFIPHHAALPVGADAITAVYSGDSSFATSSTSAAVTAVVAKDGTTTTASHRPGFG